MKQTLSLISKIHEKGNKFIIQELNIMLLRSKAI